MEYVAEQPTDAIAATVEVVAAAAVDAVVAADHYMDGNVATVVAEADPEREPGFLESFEEKYFELGIVVRSVVESKQQVHWKHFEIVGKAKETEKNILKDPLP